MSIATTGLAAIPAGHPALVPALAGRMRRWLRGRRQARVMAHVEARLREDAGLPPGATVPGAMPRLVSTAGC